jgi:phosphotransferase system IIB component
MGLDGLESKLGAAIDLALHSEKGPLGKITSVEADQWSVTQIEVNRDTIRGPFHTEFVYEVVRIPTVLTYRRGGALIEAVEFESRSSVKPDEGANRALYGRSVAAGDLLTKTCAPVPAEATAVVDVLSRLSARRIPPADATCLRTPVRDQEAVDKDLFQTFLQTGTLARMRLGDAVDRKFIDDECANRLRFLLAKKRGMDDNQASRAAKDSAYASRQEFFLARNEAKEGLKRFVTASDTRGGGAVFKCTSDAEGKTDCIGTVREEWFWLKGRNARRRAQISIRKEGDGYVSSRHMGFKGCASPNTATETTPE